MLICMATYHILDIQSNIASSMNTAHVHDYDTSTCLSIPILQFQYWWMQFDLFMPPVNQDIIIWVRFM